MQLREAAVRRGLHVSEYGILDDETGETLRCATEEEVYERLGYAWIAGAARGARRARGRPQGQAAEADRARRPARGPALPHDPDRGRQTLDQMAEEAQRRGWEYLAVTDHSASHGFGDHVTPEMLEERIEEVAELNERLKGTSGSSPAPSSTSSRTADSTTRTSCSRAWTG